MRIQVVIVIVMLAMGAMAHARPTMYGVDGEPEQGQELTLDGTALAASGVMRIYICDSPSISRASRTVQQTIVYHGGRYGPVRFRADFSGFSEGETVWVIPTDGDPATTASSMGKPTTVGHPMIYTVVWQGGFGHIASIKGTGFTSATGPAGVFIGDDPVWENCRVTVAQNIRSWTGTAVDFDVATGSLDTAAPGYVFIVDDDGDRTVRGTEIALTHPVIFSVDLDTDNGKLTLAGQGFKDRGGETIIFDDFEGGNHGAQLTTDPNTEWQAYHGGGIFSSEHPYGGSMSASTADTVGEIFDTSYYEFPPAERIFVSYQMAYVYTGDMADSGGIWKLTRVNTNAAGAGPYNGEGKLYNGQAMAVGDGWPRRYFTAHQVWGAATGWRYLDDTIPPDGTYYRMELYRDLASAGLTDGIVYWRSGSSSVVDYAAAGRAPGEDYGQNTSILGMMGSGVAAPIRIYIDDYYCANTLARVVIADSPDYEQATRVSIQPVTSWSDQDISADLNLAGLGSVSERFIIVIDQNGDASMGVSLDGGLLPVPGPPGRPIRVP